MEERIESWPVSPSEESRLSELTSDDCLVAMVDAYDLDGRPYGYQTTVVVWRSGKVSRNDYYGSPIYSEKVLEAAHDVTSLHHPIGNGKTFERTSSWIDVVVDKEGKFVRISAPAPVPMR